jgi:hypothetical protein
MNSVFTRFCPSVPRVLVQSFAIGALSLFGVLTGMAPEFQSRSGVPTFSQAAQAQNLNRDELRNYALAVMAIEPLRREAYQAIKEILGSGDVPSIACHQPNSLSGLNRNIREIAVRYCNNSISIVERYGFTIVRFNAVNSAVQGNPQLREQVQQEMLRIQQSNR